MRIPENIEELIEERESLAACLNSADYKLSKWLEKNNIVVDMDDIHGGCEMYVNPSDSANRIRQAILEKEVVHDRFAKFTNGKTIGTMVCTGSKMGG